MQPDRGSVLELFLIQVRMVQRVPAFVTEPSLRNDGLQEPGSNGTIGSCSSDSSSGRGCGTHMEDLLVISCTNTHLLQPACHLSTNHSM